MRARLLPAGDAALLVQVDGIDEVLALSAALRGADVHGVVDLVPAARTVLVQLDRSAVADAVSADRAAGGAAEIPADLNPVRAAVRAIAEATDAAATIADHEEITIPVRYDGPDLDEVARLTGMSRPEVIKAHTATAWRAAFVGFAPGFSYLTGGDGALDVPRRRESRTSVPAGSVALAGGYTAVYPRASPGGWQLIGTTAAVLWDLDRDPPARLRPGTWVRFVDLSAGAGGTDEAVRSAVTTATATTGAASGAHR